MSPGILDGIAGLSTGTGEGSGAGGGSSLSAGEGAGDGVGSAFGEGLAPQLPASRHGGGSGDGLGQRRLPPDPPRADPLTPQGDAADPWQIAQDLALLSDLAQLPRALRLGFVQHDADSAEVARDYAHQHGLRTLCARLCPG